ncbi:thioredoxin family protein [Salinibacterium sp. ZJ77]|uniref:thioredoxin family protein n=1 Tax=Salinibacterium sp. ZJ77 TaxID=2708337 RepID=UPI001421ACEB|nr:thioredoxin family protein [Salinibacterium sp. ZJ77]
MTEQPTPRVRFELFTSAFCGSCHSARIVLGHAASVIPGAVVEEHDVAFDADYAEQHDITSTPTVIVRDAEGKQVFRAEGAPSMEQVLGAAALAIHD